MHISNEQLETYRRQGFLIVENFLQAEEREAALDGFFTLFSPAYDEYVAANRKNETPHQFLFPWDHSGLNHVTTHPDLNYADDFMNLACFYCFDDVATESAPNTVIDRSWVGFTRHYRPWDGGRTFTYKSGASTAAMTRFLVEASPRQRELLGFRHRVIRCGPPLLSRAWRNGTPVLIPNPTTLQEVTHESSEKNSRHRVGSSACGTLPVLGPGRPPGRRRRRRSKRRATARIHGAESGRPAD